MSTGFAQIVKDAFRLPAEERARLADELWNSLGEHAARPVVMSPELEGLLDEGRGNYDQAVTTEELRHRR